MAIKKFSLDDIIHVHSAAKILKAPVRFYRLDYKKKLYRFCLRASGLAYNNLSYAQALKWDALAFKLLDDSAHPPVGEAALLTARLTHCLKTVCEGHEALLSDLLQRFDEAGQNSKTASEIAFMLRRNLSVPAEPKTASGLNRRLVYYPEF